MDQGATTIWECWNSYSKAAGFGDVSMNSFNHYSYGAVVGWMFSNMAGIQCDPAEPGFKHIILAPQPNQRLTGAYATYESAYGTIVSSMAYEGETWNYSCTVPANTTATIRLPVEDIETLSYTESTGLTYVGYENGVAAFEAVAGSYRFSSAITVENYVKIDVNCEKAVSPAMMNAEIRLNGEVVETTLPTLLTVQPGDKITASVEILNNVDYTFDGWTVGEAKSETLDYNVTGNDTITANILWNGYNNIAEGKTVTAEEVNATWAAAHLTDGILNHKGGTNGWSSPRISMEGVLTFDEVPVVIDLEETTDFNRVHLYPRTYSVNSALNFPTAYTIYVSDDNENWTAVYTTDSGEVPTNLYEPIILELSRTASGRYVKIGFTGINRVESGNPITYIQLSELGLYYDDTITNPDAEAAEAAEALIAAIGKVTAESGEAIEAARAAYDALTETQKALVSNLAVLEAAESTYEILTTKVVLTLTGPQTINAHDESAVYTLTAKDMTDLATMILEFEISEDYFTDPVVESAGEDWIVIYQSYENGRLVVSLGSLEGGNGEGDLMTLTLTPAGKSGEATVALTYAEMSVYLGEQDEAYVTADLTGAALTTRVEQNIFDINKDGVVNLLDLTRAQRYFGTAFKDADMNDDGKVDIDDLILILNHFE